VLRGCKRVLKQGGRLAFSVVSTADDSPSDAAEGFGGFVTESSGYTPIVEKAGFRSIECSNVTEEFHTMSLRWLSVAADLEDDLRSALGDDVFDDKLQSRKDTLDAIESGELQRLLFTATA
jgi:hypothetical protein